MQIPAGIRSSLKACYERKTAAIEKSWPTRKKTCKDVFILYPSDIALKSEKTSHDRAFRNKTQKADFFRPARGRNKNVTEARKSPGRAQSPSTPPLGKAFSFPLSSGICERRSSRSPVWKTRHKGSHPRFPARKKYGRRKTIFCERLHSCTIRVRQRAAPLGFLGIRLRLVLEGPFRWMCRFLHNQWTQLRVTTWQIAAFGSFASRSLYVVWGVVLILS